jgi:predicted Zn finger-like uncharacterized protein
VLTECCGEQSAGISGISKGEGIMLAICEECSKKYNVDESKMKGEKARFSCQECGHIIVVIKNSGNVQAAGKSSGPEAKTT